jgi:soluble lytic murein transglycosylase-like protein
MKTTNSFLRAAAFCALFACPALSQAPRYAFDNFDASTGVHIQEEAKPVQKARAKGQRVVAAIAATATSLVKKTIDSVAPMPMGPNIAISQRLDGFTTGDATIDRLIAESGARNNVDPALLYSIMHQESTFKRNALSPKGARGLMQLMPGTAARFGVRNIFDPQQNIEGGARYVRFLLDMFGEDVSLTLAGYNAGEGAVLRYGRQVPPYRETQEYVRRISNRYAVMRDPSVAFRAQRLSQNQLAALQNEKMTPLALYERNVFAVRLPDGRLQLVSQ